MQYSVSTLKKKANDAGYSFQEGYQRYNRKGWGYVPATDGDRVVGYQNGRFMDMDIEEGLAMHKDIDDYQLQIAHLLGK